MIRASALPQQSRSACPERSSDALCPEAYPHSCQDTHQRSPPPESHSEHAENGKTELYSGIVQHGPHDSRVISTIGNRYTAKPLQRATHIHGALPGNHDPTSQGSVATISHPNTLTSVAESSIFLTPDDILAIGSELAPEVYMTREHAEAPEIRSLILHLRCKACARSEQTTSLATNIPSPQVQTLQCDPASKVAELSPRRMSTALSPSTNRPAQHNQRAPQASSGQANFQQMSPSQGGRTHLQCLPARGTGAQLNIRSDEKPSGNQSQAWDTPRVQINMHEQTLPVVVPWDTRNSRSNAGANETSTYTFPESCESLDASSRSILDSSTGSFTSSPRSYWSRRSPKHDFSTPPSYCSLNASAVNTPCRMPGGTASTVSTKSGAIFDTTLIDQGNNRRLLHGEGSVERSQALKAIPIDVHSASHSEELQREKRLESSAKYRSGQPPQEPKKEAKVDVGPSAKITDAEALIPPTSCPMPLSSRQQSHSGTPPGTIQTSTLPGSIHSSGQGNECYDSPCLPELHPHERRDPLDYRPLAPFGTPETIRTYPPSFQASLHRIMGLARYTHLQSLSHHILFVYGSLMISDLFHDIFHDGHEWIFHNKLIKCCMCPAKVKGFSRFAVHGRDEPIMVKAQRNSPTTVHGMLIFGLTTGHFRILDRYQTRGFVREEVVADVNLKNSAGRFTVESYVWPQSETLPGSWNTHRINRDVVWNVADFWNNSLICRIYRRVEDTRERMAKLDLAPEQDTMSMA